MTKDSPEVNNLSISFLLRNRSFFFRLKFLIFYIMKFSRKLWCKYSETRPISDGFRKNNVNYWAFREIRSIIPHL